MKPAVKLSVIIPTREFEPNLSNLVESIESNLKGSSISFEILVSCPEGCDLGSELKGLSAQILACPKLGRSYQLNHAAESAKGDWLLFLHADSVLDSACLRKLVDVIVSPETSRNSLYYFWLRFNSDGPQMCALNAAFANLRSMYFRLPFGDQGFLLLRDSFFKIGAFPSKYASGEDHAFVQKAKSENISIKPIGAWIKTSACKYKKLGWLQVTLKHLYLTAKQEVLREGLR